MKRLLASDRFTKKLKQKYAKDNKLHKKINKQLDLLRKQDNHPSLRLHKLSGLENVWSVSIDKGIRITYTYFDENKIFLINIGSHDEVY